MNILTTGKGGTAGSWKIRGEQLGGAVGKVIPRATLKDCEKADLIVCVKRINQPWFQNVIQSGRPWIWDVVDPYPQPACGRWSKQQSVDWITKQLKTYKPNGVIWANKKMREDCDPGLTGIVIPHHHLPNIKINPIRLQVKIVGYQGAPLYLGKWLDILTKECRRRGWIFVINPLNLADVDIVVAFRDGIYNGYPQANWKSNVKLANAHGSGTPFIGPLEPSYIETQTSHEQWVETKKDLSVAFDRLTDYGTRKQIHKAFLLNRITVNDCARQLREYAHKLLR